MDSKSKENWGNTIRYTKLKIKENNFEIQDDMWQNKAYVGLLKDGAMT